MIDHGHSVIYVSDGRYELTVTTDKGPLHQTFKAMNEADATARAPELTRKILHQLAGSVTVCPAGIGAGR